MLPEEEQIIYKLWVDLVRDCNFELIVEEMARNDPSLKDILNNVKMETNRRHKNRWILMDLLQTDNANIFPNLTQSLRKHSYNHLANQLENKTVVQLHKTCCYQMADGPLPPPSAPLQINVTYATQFSDNQDCYRTRSKNRGQVLIINNINFANPQQHKLRSGAEYDDSNLKELFEKMGFTVNIYRNLNKEEMENLTEKFARQEYETEPDIGIVIIMSHGEKVNNKTVIITTDGASIEEEWIMSKFSRDCTTFRNKPKVLIFNMCRGELFDTLSNYSQYTETDSTCTKPPEHERYYGDLLICHPTVEGFRAHRDPQRGSWYVELICKVFMEKAHEMNVESMFKLVEEGLKNKISENWTTQTSTMINIGFKNLYLNPGIYEEEGEIMQFKQSI